MSISIYRVVESPSAGRWCVRDDTDRVVADCLDKEDAQAVALALVVFNGKPADLPLTCAKVQH